VESLVTGANGFVEFTRVRTMLEASNRVGTIIRTTASRHSLDGLTVELEQGALLDLEALRTDMKGYNRFFSVDGHDQS